MSMWYTTNAYERENSLMDLTNVPIEKVTVEVKETNQALIQSLRDQLATESKKAREAEESKRYWLKRYEAERAGRLELAKKQQQAGSGHRYLRLVEHLAQRKRELKNITEAAAQERAWEEGLGAEVRLNEIETALGVAGVR
ncbi:hypothetical protein V7793_05085 [Streptomyces sp. KLMMK]|uniref:hypothetical protein n=1 Tax=Streptomyces sp. KLMMK TaxID=3109353 RepID=UPI002FFF183C